MVPIRHGREEQSYRRAPKLRQARRESRVQNREIAIKTDAFDSRVFHDALVLVAGSIGIVPSEHLGKFSAYAIRQFTHRKSSGQHQKPLFTDCACSLHCSFLPLAAMPDALPQRIPLSLSRRHEAQSPQDALS